MATATAPPGLILPSQPPTATVVGTPDAYTLGRLDATHVICGKPEGAPHGHTGFTRRAGPSPTACALPQVTAAADAQPYASSPGETRVVQTGTVAARATCGPSNTAIMRAPTACTPVR